MKKLFSIIFLVTVVVFLSGCSSQDSLHIEDEPYDDIEDGGNNQTPNEDTSNNSGTSDIYSASDIPALADRKIIYEADLIMVSDNVSEVAARVNTLLTTYNGYIDSSSLSTNLYRVTIRVHSSEFDSFIASLQDGENVVSYSQTAEDITNQYSTFEANYEALQTQYDRVLALLEAATELDDILMLTDELTAIESKINTVGKQLQTFDNLVDYSTINLEVSKVQDISELLERSEKPNVSVQEIGKNSMIVKVYNYGSSDGTAYLKVKQNGELISEFDEPIYANGYYEFEVTELKSGTEYTFEATVIEFNHKVSNRDLTTATTEHTFFSKVNNTFIGSLNALVSLFEAIGITIVAVLPFLVVGIMMYFPGRVVYEKWLKSYIQKRKQIKQERHIAFLAKRQEYINKRNNQ